MIDAESPPKIVVKFTKKRKNPSSGTSNSEDESEPNPKEKTRKKKVTEKADVSTDDALTLE